MGIRRRARQQKVMLWLMPEMFHEGALTYSTSRLQGSRRNFQYLTKRAYGLSSYLGCLIRTRVRHNDNPQRVPPAGMAVSGEDTEDTLGYRGDVVVRWNDNTNRRHPRSEPTRFVVRAGVRVTTRPGISCISDVHTRGITVQRIGSRQRSKTRHFMHSGRDGPLTSSESPSPHEIVVKDQRETIKNAFHACRMLKLHMRVVARLRLQEAAGEPAVGIYEIFIEPFLSWFP
jgi:hypothetical protein